MSLQFQASGDIRIAGKGNKQAVVRFSKRALQAIRDYLAGREPVLDQLSHKQLSALQIFTGTGSGTSREPAGEPFMVQRVGPDICSNR